MKGQAQPQVFDLTADELAKWIERQGDASWWSVDGDPLLTGIQSVPCSSSQLAEAVRLLGKALFISKDDSVLEQATDAVGPTTASDLDNFVKLEKTIGDNQEEYENRKLIFKWKDREYPDVWYLLEDKQSAKWATEYTA